MVQKNGFSLLEMVFAIVIVSLGAATLASSIFKTVQHSHDLLVQQEALNIAQAYTEYLLQQPLATLSTTLPFTQSPPRTAQNITIDALAAYQISVSALIPITLNGQTSWKFIVSVQHRPTALQINLTGYQWL